MYIYIYIYTYIYLFIILYIYIFIYYIYYIIQNIKYKIFVVYDRISNVFIFFIFITTISGIYNK
jgi:hypothetical protein